jgi:predicted TIM-barrel fold metal-dependent hydrolase
MTDLKSAGATIIDAWAQPAMAGGMGRMLPTIQRLFKQSGAAQLLERGLTPAETVHAMDRAGVAKVLLTAWCGPQGWIFSNDDVAAVVREFPQRFVGVACVPLDQPMAAVRELDRAVNELGFVALRVLPWLWNRPLNDRYYFPLYVRCIELGIPFCAQVGHTGPLMPSEPGRPIPYLDEVALAFPELKIVGGHIGYPWTDEMIALAWKHENVFIDTSAYLPRYYPSQLVHFMKTYGRDKVLFATNFPMLSFEKCAEQVQDLGLSPEIEAKFLHENARRVFRLEPA